MRLTEWLQNPKLVKSAAEMFARDDTFIRMNGVLDAESPLNNPLPPHGPSADDRSYRLGLIEGYAQALKNLRMMGQMPKPPPKPLTPTYEKPEE